MARPLGVGQKWACDRLSRDRTLGPNRALSTSLAAARVEGIKCCASSVTGGRDLPTIPEA